MRLNTRILPLFLLICLCCVQGWAQQEDRKEREQSDQMEQGDTAEKTDKARKKSDQQQMRGLDDEIQQIKSDVLNIAQELRRLEEKLLFPSGTQVAIFVSLAKGDPMRLDAVQLQIDGSLVAHHIYSAKELEALRKGGVQRIYVGNVASGDHQLEVLVEGKSESGEDFSSNQSFPLTKEVKPKMVGLTLAGPGSESAPITLGDW